MPVKLKIKVTKEILEATKYCVGSEKGKGDSCAIAVAIKTIFPIAYVCTNEIYVDGDLHNRMALKIPLPKLATEFIDEFDFSRPEYRASMQPIEFEIEIPDTVIEKINIDELRPLLENHPTLELINH